MSLAKLLAQGTPGAMGSRGWADLLKGTYDDAVEYRLD